MKQLVFNFNMFDAGQKAVIIDTETGNAIATYSIDGINSAGEVIAKACIETDILDVHLFGEEVYLTDFVIPEIRKYLNLSHYIADNVRIEVN